MKNRHPDDSTLLVNIQLRERVAYEFLYRYIYPSIARYVQKNNGNRADAEDLFQETLLALVENVKQPGFQLRSSLKTYLFSIARNLWLKRLRQQQPDLIDDFSPFESLTDTLPNDSREGLLTNWLSKVSPMCRLLLKALFYENQPIAQLMLRMGWKNKHTADNQKYKCVQQIRKVATVYS
ncbi:sigma-70 family RNA polymerase sigma factor [Spirosoma sp. SC4-14]|uniref:RNA polymerase sigma factor n=1 Tax=Spirosoma sp. SC4-14 TaxID=3128900 RepID=UPI0030D032CA